MLFDFNITASYASYIVIKFVIALLQQLNKCLFSGLYTYCMENVISG